MNIDPYRLSGIQIKPKYRLMEFVGAGGMGAVYRSLDQLECKHVAVKILKPDLVARFPEYTQLFTQEVNAAKELKHPNIVKVITSGTLIEGFPYIVMEWLEGLTLDKVLATSLLPLERTLRIFEQICSGIAYAHKHKIIHLDLKPENIFLISKSGNEDIVKIIDFGLARILSTFSGTTVTRFGGSLHYCSPEHFGGKVSPRSDIFSLGVILYHMLSGVLPVGGSYIAAKQRGGPLPSLPSLRQQNPKVPTAIEHVLQKALEFDAADRYQSVEEFFGDVSSAFSSSE